jgi:hypothetical protein
MMSADTIVPSTYGQPRRGDPSPDIGVLTSAPGWEVRRSPTTAEWHHRSKRDGRRIGSTPIRPGVIAAMLWSGDLLVDHSRGTEAAMCARGHRRIATVTRDGDLLSG